MNNLASSIESILDALGEALEAATSDEGLLDGVADIVRGDRSRPMPKMPAIWYVPGEATFVQESYGAETWALPIVIAALVKDTDPVEGARKSQQLAAKAREVARAARPSDETAVTDITSQSFDPTAHSSEQNRTLFWTEATILVVFDCS